MKRSVSVCALSIAAGLILFSFRATASNLQRDTRIVSLESLTAELLGGSSGNSDQILSVAEQRHARLQQLMSADPGALLRMAIEPEIRQSLPGPIRGFVEEAVELDGTLDVLIEEYAENSRTRHFLDTGDERYELFFTSDPPRMVSGQSVRIRGVRVDHAIAVEPTSENLRIGGTRGAGMQSAAAIPSSFGAQSTIVILVNFSDNAVQPYTAASAKSLVFTTVSNFDLENSYGQTWLTGDVAGWYTIPLSSTVCDYASIQTYARSAATAAGVNLANYAHQVYAFPANACGWWGLGSVGGAPSSAWINGSFQLQVVAHEMGHNLGLYHAHSLSCGGVTLGTTCTSSEYGDTLDTMGYSAYHFNSFQKERLGWLGYGSSPALTTVTSSGTYAIDPYETNGSASKALKIARGTTGSYFYLELRRGLGFDASLGSNSNISSGVVFHLASPSDGASSNLLDMTPVNGSFSDPALVAGQTFTDSDSGVSVVVNSVSSTGASISVALGGAPPPAPPATCANVAPTVGLVPSQTSGVAAGTAVAFTLSLTNNDVSPCTSSTFGLSAVVPSGWIGSFSTTSLTVAPGASGSATLTVTSPTTAANGSFTITAAARNSAATTAATSASAVYVVNNPTNVGSGGSFADNFNRSDSAAPGNGWSVARGSLGIVSGEMRSASGSSDNIAVVTGLTGTTATVAADFASTNNSKSPQLGLVVRYQDANNYYALYRNIAAGGGRRVRISKFVNGVETVLANVSDANPAENSFFHMVARASGTSLSLEVDGVVVATASDAAFHSGMVGIRMASSIVSNRADNFTATVQ